MDMIRTAPTRNRFGAGLGVPSSGGWKTKNENDLTRQRVQQGVRVPTVLEARQDLGAKE